MLIKKCDFPIIPRPMIPPVRRLLGGWSVGRWVNLPRGTLIEDDLR